MNRPSFQFYPNDWTANPNLRRCTFAEKGIWIDVMCLLHDQPEYGIVRWPLKEIAEAVKCKPADLAALVRKGVLKGDDKNLTEAFVYVPRSGRVDGEPVTLIDTQAGPIWYSSRMVKDEHVRTIRGNKTRFGAPEGEASKPPPKSSPKPGFGDGSSSSSSSSASDKQKPSVPDGTGDSSPKAPTKPRPVDPEKDELWQRGRKLLEGEGMTREAAGSFLGKLCKDHGQKRVLEAVRDADRDPKADVKSWLVAACQERVQTNPQQRLEAHNRAVADAWTPPEERHAVG